MPHAGQTVPRRGWQRGRGTPLSGLLSQGMGGQEPRCPDSESHLCDEQVTTRFPLPNGRQGKSPIILHIMRRSLKEGLEFGKAKRECSLASILHCEASLFSYVIMVVVLALEV